MLGGGEDLSVIERDHFGIRQDHPDLSKSCELVEVYWPDGVADDVYRREEVCDLRRGVFEDRRFDIDKDIATASAELVVK